MVKKELTREEKEKKERNKLKKLFKNIEPNKRKLIEDTIEQCAFMSASLCELQKGIREVGETIVAVNGNGFTTMQENPAVRSYNNMMSKYTNLYKILFELIPEEAKTSKLKDLMDE